MPRRTILFTSSLSSTFILEDLELLRRTYSVTRLVTRGPLAPLRIVQGVVRHDITFTWFASVYAFFVVLFARIAGRPSIVVLAGADLADRPDLGYGSWRHPWKRIFLRWTLRHATRCLAVDPTLRDRARLLAGYDGGNVQVVATGYDGTFWVPGSEKEPHVLTVASCDSLMRLRVKGIDLLWDVARMMPDLRFIVVGIPPRLLAVLPGEMPRNIEVIPPVPRTDVLPFYQRAAVYCQPSRSEGLPNSLCEAMLCGCVPVGTSVGGIPAAIGQTGVVVPPDDGMLLADALRSAFRLAVGGGAGARQRILERFPLERREEALRGLISGFPL